MFTIIFTYILFSLITIVVLGINLLSNKTHMYFRQNSSMDIDNSIYIINYNSDIIKAIEPSFRIDDNFIFLTYFNTTNLYYYDYEFFYIIQIENIEYLNDINSKICYLYHYLS